MAKTKAGGSQEQEAGGVNKKEHCAELKVSPHEELNVHAARRPELRWTRHLQEHNVSEEGLAQVVDAAVLEDGAEEDEDNLSIHNDNR